METSLLGGKGGWGCADLNNMHCMVMNSECVSDSFLQLLVDLWEWAMARLSCTRK